MVESGNLYFHTGAGHSSYSEQRNIKEITICQVTNSTQIMLTTDFTSNMPNRPNSQSHYAPVPYPPKNAPLFNRNVHACTFLLQNVALWDVCLMHCGISVIGVIVVISVCFICSLKHMYSALPKWSEYFLLVLLVKSMGSLCRNSCVTGIKIQTCPLK